MRNLESSLKEIHAKADAIICDYHLRIRSYSPFDGDQLVALSNIGRFPALLCTTYDDADITLLRSKRRFIPILLRPSTYNPDTIVRGFERCLKESAGKYNPSRKPWRTLVRITQVDESGEYFYIVVPGWNADQKIRIYFADLPPLLSGKIETDMRFYAQVNIGADSADELYVCEWEVQ